MPTDPRPLPSAPTQLRSIDGQHADQILAALEQDGACIALNLLTPESCEQLLRDFAPHLEQVTAGVDNLGYREQFYGAHTKRLHGLFSRSPQMATVLTQPLLLSLARTLLVANGTATDLRLSNAELMVLQQNQTQQVFHRDAASWQRAQALATADLLLSANYALTDFTADNGATWVVPGSHRWPPGQAPRPSESTQAVMPQGSALLYLGSAIHAGGANQTAMPRVGLYLGYIASWLRPLENQLITNRPEDVLALPEEARRLLDISPGGYTVYA